MLYYPTPMQPARLDINAQPNHNADLKIVRLDGKLALETVHNFVSTMRAESAKRLVLDMGGLSFLDSAGVGALVQLFVHRRATGKELALAALTPQSDAVIQVAGLKKLLPVFASVEEAH